MEAGSWPTGDLRRPERHWEEAGLLRIDAMVSVRNAGWLLSEHCHGSGLIDHPCLKVFASRSQ